MPVSSVPLRAAVAEFLRDDALDPVVSQLITAEHELQIMYQSGGAQRIPADRNGQPNCIDTPAPYFDAENVKNVGTSGWNWWQQRTDFVIFDFDDDSHRGGNPLTQTDLRAVLRHCRLIGYAWARRSKGGKAFHIIVVPATPMPAATGAEHQTNARAILARMSEDASFDFGKYVDAKGVIGWVWASEVGKRGFELLHKPKREPPTIACESTACESLAAQFDELCEHPKVKPGEQQLKHIQWLKHNGYAADWDESENRLKTHTKGLEALHKALSLPGKFTTTSEGTNIGEPNCFAHPRQNGEWFVMRYGTPQETDDWDKREDGRVSVTLASATTVDGGKFDMRKSLIDISDEHELFHTPDDIPVARLNFNGFPTTLLLPDSTYEGILATEALDRHGRVAKTAELKDALRLIEMRAIKGPERSVFGRFGFHEGKIYIDLGDKSLRVVQITPENWDLVDTSPVLFLRPAGMAAFPEPKRGGRLDELRPFVNVTNDDWPVLVAFILGAFNPHGPYPVLHLIGQSGTAKTTVARMTKSVIDPYRANNEEEVYSEPKDVENLMVHATSAWLLPFDNQTSISDTMSDAFCRLSTGGATVKRKLYTDGKVARLKAKRPVIITAIHDIVNREDLRNRTLFVRPPRLLKETGETELNEAFDNKWPFIMGAVFGAVSTALRNFDTTPQIQGNRMVDFTKWAIAGEPVTGLEPGTIRQALIVNRKTAAEEALQSPFAQEICKLACEGGGYKALPTDLLSELQSQRVEDLPRNPISLGIRLTELASEMRAVGVIVEKRGRHWHIERAGNESSAV